MVLAELGQKITKALVNMKKSTVVDDQVIDDMLKEIQRALLESDVNVRLVVQLRDNIKKKVCLPAKQRFARLAPCFQ